MFVKLTEEELAHEEWRDITEFTGYQVSNMGRIRSLDRIVSYTNKLGKEVKLTISGQIISLRQHKRDKYLKLRIRNNSKRIVLSVHRLVAKAFLPNPNNLYTINHKDEDRTNNKVTNLEWMSIKDNDNYGRRNTNIRKARLKQYKDIKFAKAIDNIVINVYDDILKIKDENKTIVYKYLYAACMEHKQYKGYYWYIINDEQYKRLSDELSIIQWPKL